MQVTVEIGSLLEDISKGCQTGLIAAAEQILSDCNQYCFLREGQLMGSANQTMSAESLEVSWNTVYAARCYYEFTPLLGNNPNAKSHWAEKAAEDFGDTWAQQIAKGAGLS